tara:strand:+ start:2706 stop:4370 length:1665 start_codon:yes stop_codon:yes gene_type:complete
MSSQFTLRKKNKTPQKDIYNYMKRKALGYEGKISHDLKTYRLNQKKFSNRPFELVKLEELINALHESKIAYLGDFHTFDENSKNLKRIIKALYEKAGTLTLGMEIVHEKNQEEITRYLKGTITELEFLEGINYHDSWRFPWNHYKTLFDLAKKHGFEIVALNSEGTLKERDEKAAEIIVSHKKRHPNSNMLVLFGELHIIPNKIPQLVSQKMKDIHQTIIHQNLDEVFWKLDSMNKVGGWNDRIVKFNSKEFCLQTSMPWIKYESMIYWYENLCEDPEFDLHQYIIETGSKLFSSNIQENFLLILQKITSQLNLEISDSDLENFNLYDHQKINIILHIVNALNRQPLVNFYVKLIMRGKSFKIPFSNEYYCSNYSVNRISFLAGQHIQYILSNKLSLKNREKVILGKNQINKFLFFLYQNISAYLSSKIINPYRKCNLYQDFKIEIQSNKTSPTEVKLLKICIDILDKKDLLDEAYLKITFKGLSIANLFKICKSLGYLMSDFIFEEFFKKNHPHFPEIKNNIFIENYSIESLKKVIKLIFPNKEYIGQKKRFF